MAVVKRLFLRMLSGLENPDRGVIRIGDNVVFDTNTNLAPNQRQIAIVFQNYALLPHLSIAQTLLLEAKQAKKNLYR